MRILLHIAMVLTVGLMACAPTAAQQAPQPPAATAKINPRLANVVPPDPEECRARRGTIQTVCMLRVQMCVTPYPDAGKPCSGKKDCQGRCLASGREKAGEPARGTCQKDNAPCGCFTTVEDGKVAGGVCVD